MVTGRRIFKMAPLHHHFEMQGQKETKIVVRFWIVGILLALLSLSSFKNSMIQIRDKILTLHNSRIACAWRRNQLRLCGNFGG